MAGPGQGPNENAGPVKRRRQPHAWAVGLTIGLLWAWFPKDNLFSLGLIMIAVGYRPPWMAVLVGLPVGVVTGLLLEPTALWLGERLLETPILIHLLTWTQNQPLLPWLGLNSSLMLGILSLASWLVVPGYWLTRELIEQLLAEPVSSRQRNARPSVTVPGRGLAGAEPLLGQDRFGGDLAVQPPSPPRAGEAQRYLRWDEPQPAAERFLHRRAGVVDDGLMLSDVLRWAPEDAELDERDAALAELPERLLELEELLSEAESESAALGPEALPVLVDQADADAGQRALFVIDTALDILRLDDSAGAAVPVPRGVYADPRSGGSRVPGAVGDGAKAEPPAAPAQPTALPSHSDDPASLRQRVDGPVGGGDDRDAALPFLLGHLQRHRSAREDA